MQSSNTSEEAPTVKSMKEIREVLSRTRDTKDLPHMLQIESDQLNNLGNIKQVIELLSYCKRFMGEDAYILANDNGLLLIKAGGINGVNDTPNRIIL